MYTINNIKECDALNNKGIYLIHSRTTGKDYIGSTTKSFYIRWNQHIKDLYNDKHHNSNISTIYKDYTISDFVFIVLECLDNIDNILTIEQQYINTWHPELNIGTIYQQSLFDIKQYVITSKDTKVKGVFKNKDKFGAKLYIHNKRLVLGYFNTKLEAEEAVNLGNKLFNTSPYTSKTKEEQLHYIYSFYGFLYKNIPIDPIAYLRCLLDPV